MKQLFCYCDECRARTGGDKWFGIWYQYANFTFVGGESSIYTRKGSSGHDVHHHFCPDCGVTVCADITVGKFFTIAAPSFDDSQDFQPEMAIFTASAPEWAVLPVGIPCYETFPASSN